MESFYDVSLVIIDKNCSALLERCIRSCSAQTYPGRLYEIILLHDGQNPIVNDVLENYSRHHTIHPYLTGMEPDEILQSAIKHSSGRFMVFVDSEDFISDYMLLVQTIFLYDNPSLGSVSVDYWKVNIESDKKLERISSVENPILHGLMFKKDLLVKLTRSEGPVLTYEPEALKEILMRNAPSGHMPISFYRKSVLQ